MNKKILVVSVVAIIAVIFFSAHLLNSQNRIDSITLEAQQSSSQPLPLGHSSAIIVPHLYIMSIDYNNNILNLEVLLVNEDGIDNVRLNNETFLIVEGTVNGSNTIIGKEMLDSLPVTELKPFEEISTNLTFPVSGNLQEFKIMYLIETGTFTAQTESGPFLVP
ncbi:hypothetical protein [Nitrosopumilus sp.]|uniref:hypothetical protein n=1 Tax=Nitrosopumilus sp. TaxID=2024843 RepID=UPI003D11216C